jgi:hypothetical protein
MARNNRQRRQAYAKSAPAPALATCKLFAPGTPAAEFGELLEDAFGPGPVTPHLITLLREEGWPLERLAGIAAQVLDQASPASRGSPAPSLTVLTFAAAVARASGSEAEADRLLDQAFAAAEYADDSGLKMELIGVLPGHGRLADALDMLTGHLRLEPNDDQAVELYGFAIAEAFGRRGECTVREREALARFADRSAMRELRDAVAASLSRTGYQAAVDDHVAEWLRFTRRAGWDPGSLDLLVGLAAEVGLVAAPVPDAPVADQAENNALMAFATDRSVPFELAARARTWRTRVRYGLWRIDDPRPAPGVWCTDVLTGIIRYVEFPAEILAEFVPWAVWYGGIVPFDGVWRSTGLGARLSPAEADAAADLIFTGTAVAVLEANGRASGPAGTHLREPMKLGDAEPRGVLVDLDEPYPDDAARTVSKMAGAAIPRVLAEVRQYRAVPPAPRNTSDEPLCLISAHITATNPALLQAALLDSGDFEGDPADPGLLGWLAPGSPRVVLGTLRFTRAAIVAEVNSRERFARLHGLLTSLDGALAVLAEKQIDPVLHTAWPAEPRMTSRGDAWGAEGWEDCWLDQPVLALGKRTPRQAAGTADSPMLETLLRQFEYEAALLACDGKAGIDTALLRRELGMEEPILLCRERCGKSLGCSSFVVG